ncbi:MAG TPA: hypothetical protein VJ622_00915 [Acidimicrobiia bacterium]|nr:hypothetical protein [Acidimicrobiia bacterium]HMC81080.1 hypothetical protein [Acidimicrobiia bacterium]
MTIDEQKLEAFVHQAIGDLGAPGAIRYTVPGMMSPVDPSSCWMCRLPDTTYPTCSTWHESVPTTGLMHVDQRQPGWNVNRPTSPSPTLTTSTVAPSGASDLFGCREIPDLHSCHVTSPFGSKNVSTERRDIAATSDVAGRLLRLQSLHSTGWEGL